MVSDKAVRRKQLRKDILSTLRSKSAISNGPKPLLKRKLRKKVIKARRKRKNNINNKADESELGDKDWTKALQRLVDRRKILVLATPSKDGNDDEERYMLLGDESNPHEFDNFDGRTGNEEKDDTGGDDTSEMEDDNGGSVPHRSSNRGTEAKGEVEPAALPIAEVLRRRAAGSGGGGGSDEVHKPDKGTEEEEDVIPSDVDEQIRILEAELEADDDDEGKSETDDEDEEEGGDDDDEGNGHDERSDVPIGHNSGRVSFGDTTILNPTLDDGKETKLVGAGYNNNGDHDDGGGIICLSTVAADRIEPLPPTALPSGKRRKLKGIDNDYDPTTDDAQGTNSKKKKRKGNKEQQQQQQNDTTKVIDGIAIAVNEILGNYAGREEKKGLPFYCRICNVQLDNEIDFTDHMKSKEHKATVVVMRKATYCKLCKKQFTSPIQMKEHLTSKKHRDVMDYVKACQRGEIMPRKGDCRFSGRKGDKEGFRSRHQGRGRFGEQRWNSETNGRREVGQGRSDDGRGVGGKWNFGTHSNGRRNVGGHKSNGGRDFGHSGTSKRQWC